jgi:hypothetical protein
LIGGHLADDNNQSWNIAQALVGQMVSVFDSIEFTWNDGLIQEYDPTTKLHKVVRKKSHSVYKTIPVR